jgi:hypothetical protein
MKRNIFLKILFLLLSRGKNQICVNSRIDPIELSASDVDALVVSLTSTTTVVAVVAEVSDVAKVPATVVDTTDVSPLVLVSVVGDVVDGVIVDVVEGVVVELGVIVDGVAVVVALVVDGVVVALVVVVDGVVVALVVDVDGVVVALGVIVAVVVDVVGSVGNSVTGVPALKDTLSALSMPFSTKYSTCVLGLRHARYASVLRAVVVLTTDSTEPTPPVTRQAAALAPTPKSLKLGFATLAG